MINTGSKYFKNESISNFLDLLDRQFYALSTVMNIGENVWYHKQSIPLEKEIISHFKTTGIWKKVIWSNNEFERSDLKYRDNDDYYQHVYRGVPEDLYVQLFANFHVFQDMYVRWSPISSFEYDSRNVHDYLNIFNMMVDYTYHRLLDEKISLVIFNRAPHMGGDYILYLLAEKTGIKTLIMEPSIIPNRFFYTFRNDDFGSFNSCHQLYEVKAQTLEKKFKKVLLYMRVIQEKKKDLRTKLYTYIHKEYRFLKELFSRENYSLALHRYHLKREYEANCKRSEVEPDFSCKFVYFPLHLQPEKTTSAWGGKFADQVLALERLSEFIPNDWLIYAKENPKQNHVMRGRYFYQRISRISKLKLIKKEIDTYELLENSEFAATITGTVGWEAICGGKNVLIFGWGAWYKTLPGVFSYSPDLEVEDVMNYKINHNDLETAYSKLLTKMGKGIINLPYRHLYPDYDEQENLFQVINEMKRILYPELKTSETR